MRWNGRQAPVHLTPLLCSGLLFLCGAPAAAQDTPDPGGRAAARQVLRETYRYDASIRERALEEAATDPEVVQMARVMVLDSRLASLLDQILAGQRRAAEAEKPSLANGVAVNRTLAGLPARIGVQPYQDLLPSGPAIARWTLLNVKW